MSDDDVARRLLEQAGLLEPTPKEQADQGRGHKAVESAIGIVNMFPDSAIPTFGVAVPRIVQSTLKEFRETGVTTQVEALVAEGRGDSDEARDLLSYVARSLAIAVVAIVLMSDTVGIAFDTSPDAPGQEGG